MRISRAKSTEEFGYLDSKKVPEPHVRQARPPYRAWEGWEIPDGGWEVPWAVVTCCKILLNIQKQRVLMGRENHSWYFDKDPIWCSFALCHHFHPQAHEEPGVVSGQRWACPCVAQVVLQSDAPTVQTWVDAHLPSGSFLAFSSPSLRLHKYHNINSISVIVSAGLRVLPREMLEAVSYRE